MRSTKLIHWVTAVKSLKKPSSHRSEHSTPLYNGTSCTCAEKRRAWNTSPLVTSTAFLGTDFMAAGISVSYRSRKQECRARVASITHCCTLTLPLSRFDSWSIVRSATRMLLLACVTLPRICSSLDSRFLGSGYLAI